MRAPKIKPHLMIKTLCSLLFIVLLFGSSHAWMDPLYITPQIIEDPRPRIPLNTSSDNYRPIQITFDTSNSYYPEKLQYLNDYIFPQVQNYLKAALKVLPRSSRVFPTAGICGDKIKIPSDASETGYDTDIVIYVRIYNEQTYKNFFNFSKGAACGLDETTGRPIVGALMFDSVFDGHPYQNGELERRVGEVIRELVHVLGFRDTLFPYYINPETFQPLTGHFFNKTVNDFNTLVLNVAPLTQKVRDYFSCPTAEGAYLENQGDNLTMNSHFERRVFGNELMTAGDKADKRISQFTLALLEGTGWYKANYDLAEPMTWGKNQGCAFLDTKCVDPVTLKPNFKEFCSNLTSQFPSWTKRGIAFCGISLPKYIETNPNLPAAFDYWGNQTIVFDPYSDNCPTDYLHYRTAELHASPDYDCENPDTVEDCTLREEEIRGFGSKVFMGNLTRRRWTKAEYNGSCFKPNCVLQIDGRYELQVNFGNGGVVTCSEAGWINSTKFGFKHELVGGLECPDPNEFCGQILAEGSCKGQCYGNGACINRRCQCKEGWGYRTCLEKTEFPRSGRCTEDPLRTTAYGDDCICSKYNNTCQCALGLKTGDICKKKPTKIDL